MDVSVDQIFYSLKPQKCTPYAPGSKYLGIWKFEFLTKAQFLGFVYLRISKVFLLSRLYAKKP